jgi:hypothetical protein
VPGASWSSQPFFASIDLTQDASGFFYLGADFAELSKQLCSAVSSKLDRELVVGRNSFSSCIYLEEPADAARMTLKVKIYNKGLALIQSRTAYKQLGMNTKKLFSSKGIEKRVLKETQETGLSRIEITHKFRSAEAYQEFLRPAFLGDAAHRVELVLAALAADAAYSYRLPQLRLLETFQELAKKKQVYIEMRYLSALIYCSNDKRGGYTGHFKNIGKTDGYETEEFIKAS